MRIQVRASRAIIAALASMLALSCDNNYGILQTVQGESKQKGASIFQETSVFNAFRLGSTYYAATGGTLQASAVGADSWSTVRIVSGSYTLRSAVLAGEAVGGTIYALIETGGEANLSISVYHSSDGSTWTAVANLPTEQPTGSTTSATTVKSLDALYAADRYVYAEYHKYLHNPNSTTQNGPSTYTLYYYDSVSDSFKLVTGIAPGSDETFRGVVYDGTNYWFATEDHLLVTTDYTGAMDPTSETSTISGYLSTSVPSFSMSAGVTSGWTIWAISYTGDLFNDKAVYLSTKGGYLLQYKVGATSISSEAVNTSVPLTQVTAIPASGGGNNYSLVVGTDAVGTTAAVGYYEGSFGSLVIGSSGSVASSSDANSIFSTTVSTDPVHLLFWDAANYNALLCVSPGASSTSYYGLYQSTWAPGSYTWTGWAAQ